MYIFNKFILHLLKQSKKNSDIRKKCQKLYKTYKKLYIYIYSKKNKRVNVKLKGIKTMRNDKKR